MDNPSAMNKIERVLAALRLEEVDRPPFSFWYHFGLQHMPGSYHARAEIDFFRAYDLDFLKVMNDYPYPLPGGLDSIQSEEDWRRFEPIEGRDPCWKEQLTALSIIADAIGKEALFIDTVFNPWTVARKLAGLNCLEEARRRFPEALLAAMESIAASLAAYAREAIARGAAGIFLSVGAATYDLMTEEEYSIWCRPFDLKVLEAVKGAPFNVLHIHGRNIHFDSLLDYPVSAINWSHFAAAPTLKEGRQRSGRAVMGGINEAVASQVTPPEIMAQVRSALVEVGSRGLIISPGCAIPTETPVRNLRAVRVALELAG